MEKPYRAEVSGYLSDYRFFTRWYASWQEAQIAGEKLGAKKFGKYNLKSVNIIDV